MCADLDAWRREQLVLAALTLPRRDGENLEDFAKRVVQDANDEGAKAALFTTADVAALRAEDLAAIERLVHENIRLKQELEAARATEDWQHTALKRMQLRLELAGALADGGSGYQADSLDTILTSQRPENLRACPNCGNIDEGDEIACGHCQFDLREYDLQAAREERADDANDDAAMWGADRNRPRAEQDQRDLDERMGPAQREVRKRVWGNRRDADAELRESR